MSDPYEGIGDYLLLAAAGIGGGVLTFAALVEAIAWIIRHA